MNQRTIFFIIGMAVVIMGSVLFFVFSATAKQAQDFVLTEAENVTLNNEFVRKGIFEMGDPAYFTTNHSCTAPFADEAYVSLVMSYQAVPRSCEIFVNGQLIRSQRELRPECREACPYEDFSRSVFIDYLDVRDNHEIRICCNSICIEKILQEQC